MENKDPNIARTPRVPLTDLRRGECRYIIDHETFPALFCAAPTRPGTNWCEPHCKVVYARDHARRRARLLTEN